MNENFQLKWIKKKKEEQKSTFQTILKLRDPNREEDWF